MAFDWSSAQVRDWREDWADMTRPLERFLGPAAEQAMASAMGTAQGDWDEIRQTQRDTLKLRFMVRCIDAAASRVEALAHHAPDWMPLHHALRGQSIAARMHDADGVWAASLHVEQAIQHFAAIAWEPTGLPAPAKLLLKQTMEDAWLNRTECDYDLSRATHRTASALGFGAPPRSRSRSPASRRRVSHYASPWRSCCPSRRQHAGYWTISPLTWRASTRRGRRGGG